MEATVGSVLALDYLQQHHGETLKVHSMFRHTVNLLTHDGRVLALIDDEVDLNPMCLQLSFTPLLRELVSGDLAEIKRGYLYLPRFSVRIDFQAKAWDPHLPDVTLEWGGEELAKRYDLLLETILQTGNFKGIASLLLAEEQQNPYARFIRSKLTLFEEHLAEADPEKVRNDISGIVGFGPGLTPSTDDYLTGVLATLHLFRTAGGRRFVKLTEDIPKIAKGKTTIVSEDMLELAAHGMVSKNYGAFLEAFFGKKKRSAAALKKMMQSVVAHGETSGTDFLLGVLKTKPLIITIVGGIHDSESH